MPEATLKIHAVKPLKSGTTNGRAWTLFEIQADGGRRFTTFDGEWERHVGETVTAPYEVTSNGASQRLGSFPKVARAGAKPGPSAATGPDRFAMLNAKLDRVLTELAAIRKHFAA